MMSWPVQPAATGMALFSSLFQGAVFPGCAVEFMRIKKGRLHLVEFHVVLHSSVTYQFRIFTYPAGRVSGRRHPGRRLEDPDRSRAAGRRDQRGPRAGRGGPPAQLRRGGCGLDTALRADQYHELTAGKG